MNESPHTPDELFSRVHGFIAAMQNGEMSSQDREEFESLICDNPQACDLFIRYMVTTSDLRAWASQVTLESEEDLEIAKLFATDSETEGNRGATRSQLNGPLSPPIVVTSPAEGWQGALGFFAQEVPFSYLMSTVLLSIILLGAWQWKLPIPTQVATSPPLPARSVGDPASAFVGRITGTIDCKWADLSTAAFNGAYVPLNRKYALSSGLLEITYDSGAKVILQGPATYEVESAAGGFLSVGKLTARVEKRAEGGGRKAEETTNLSSSDQPSVGARRGAGGEGGQKYENRDQSQTALTLTLSQRERGPDSSSAFRLPPSALFAVRTPTAVVTDLGTEFGVTVSEQGATQVHVLQGLVEARGIGRQGESIPLERLSEGMAVEIGQGENRIETVTFAPESFTRHLRQPIDNAAETAYMKAVLADKPMGYWPLNEPAGARRFLDRSGHDIHGFAMGKPLAGQPGPLSGKSRALLLDGHSYIDLGRHDEFAMKNDFTVEAWLWIDKPRETSFAISALGRVGDNNIGWGLVAGRDQPDAKDDATSPVSLHFVVHQAKKRFYVPLSEGESIERQWVHVAVVYDRANTAHFYLNGQYRGSATDDKPAVVGPVWLQIGCAEPVDVDTDFWRGRLAHVAVYPCALGAEQIQNHYRLRSAGGKETPDQQQ